MRNENYIKNAESQEEMRQKLFQLTKKSIFLRYSIIVLQFKLVFIVLYYSTKRNLSFKYTER